MAFVINIVLDKQDFLKFQMQKSRLDSLYRLPTFFP